MLIKILSHETDAVITSGGAWTGDHDMVAKVLEELGWKEVFHRIRIGPGKAVGFGILNKKPVFILPGGPPSNLMGFPADRSTRPACPCRSYKSRSANNKSQACL